MLIYSPQNSLRLTYILRFIFNDVYAIDFSLTTDKEKLIAYNGAKLNYSEESIPDILQIKPEGLLFEKSIEQKTINVTKWNEMPMFFETSKSSDIPFDLFAASFYLISRYEEYLPFTPDKHGRFEADQSLAYKNNFLYDPIVDNWLCYLGEILNKKYSTFKPCSREFKYISTIDIDNAYAYLYKGAVRTIGATMRDLLKLNFSENVKRFQTFKGERDPFDTYSYFDSQHKKYGITPIWFFLVGKYSTYDKNLPLNNESFKSLIHEISERTEIGIHPSYESNKSFEKLKKEFVYLSKLSEKPIVRSRQHFLKLLFTETYQNLIKLGIKEDYTLGYASDVGFRASTCTPFYFFDLHSNTESQLRIFPFQVMDATLNQYMKLNVEEAIDKVALILDKVKKVKGTFISLWHNESLSDHGHWKGWEIVYKKMLEMIFSS